MAGLRGELTKRAWNPRRRARPTLTHRGLDVMTRHCPHPGSQCQRDPSKAHGGAVSRPPREGGGGGRARWGSPCRCQDELRPEGGGRSGSRVPTPSPGPGIRWKDSAHHQGRTESRTSLRKAPGQSTEESTQAPEPAWWSRPVLSPPCAGHRNTRHRADALVTQHPWCALRFSHPGTLCNLEGKQASRQTTLSGQLGHNEPLPPFGASFPSAVYRPDHLCQRAFPAQSQACYFLPGAPHRTGAQAANERVEGCSASLIFGGGRAKVQRDATSCRRDWQNGR